MLPNPTIINISTFNQLTWARQTPPMRAPHREPMIVPKQDCLHFSSLESNSYCCILDMAYVFLIEQQHDEIDGDLAIALNNLIV